MIKKHVKEAFLKRITGFDSSSISAANYIALASFIDESDFEEISTKNSGVSTGYKRYPIGQYAAGGNNLEVKSVDNEIYITNKSTIYFDEATADWKEKAKFFVLTTGGSAGSNDAVAWGEIVDSDGNPKDITVLKEQLPIIRAGQLKISLSEVVRTKYSVAFEVNSGQPIKTKENLYNIPSVEAERTGYVFDGWFREPELITPALPGTPLTDNITIYAKWIEAFEVKFIADGNVIDTQSIGNGRLVSMPEDPVKDGYKFIGWFTEDTFENEFDPTTPIVAATTLYAKFEQIQEEI